MCSTKAEKINKIKSLYIQLLDLINNRTYGHGISFSKSKISDIITSIDNTDVSEALVKMYLDLFKDPRYMQELYIWDQDYGKEESNNRPLRDLQEQVWSLLYSNEHEKVKRLQKLYPSLIAFFKKYTKNNYSQDYLYHINVLKGVVDYLNNVNFDTDDLKMVLKDIYDMSNSPLFSMHSALDEFYIWDNASENEKALNTQLDYIRDEIYEILKDYIKR
jgi:hypothetical protein